eukprot:9316551-Alexandrium_andersonii.AAC.1
MDSLALTDRETYDAQGNCFHPLGGSHRGSDQTVVRRRDGATDGDPGPGAAAPALRGHTHCSEDGVAGTRGAAER